MDIHVDVRLFFKEILPLLLILIPTLLPTLYRIWAYWLCLGKLDSARKNWPRRTKMVR